LVRLFLVRCCLVVGTDDSRIHEATAESAQAGIFSCCDFDQCLIANVPGSKGCSSCDAQRRAREAGPVCPPCLSCALFALTNRLAVEVIKDFIALDPETQPRNVTAWTPVVTDVLRGSIEFEESQVCHFRYIYPNRMWLINSSWPTCLLSIRWLRIY
jgi:hypothetical protein